MCYECDGHVMLDKNSKIIYNDTKKTKYYSIL